MSEYGPEFDAYAERVRREVVPKIEGSSIFVSITPANQKEVDVKFAMELGLAIMFDKPILAVIRPGSEIPEKLARVVERFVELGNLDDPAETARMGVAIQEFCAEHARAG